MALAQVFPGENTECVRSKHPWDHLSNLVGTTGLRYLLPGISPLSGCPSAARACGPVYVEVAGPGCDAVEGRVDDELALDPEAPLLRLQLGCHQRRPPALAGLHHLEEIYGVPGPDGSLNDRVTPYRQSGHLVPRLWRDGTDLA